MITHVKGDLLASDCSIIGHQCNCFCTFGAGIARAIREQFPKAYEADLATKRGDRDKMGTFTDYQYEDRHIYNLYGQYGFGPGRQTDYDALEQALTGMAADLAPEAGDRYKIGFPRLGCGLAGGEWSVVEAILERVWKDRQIYVYSL